MSEPIVLVIRISELTVLSVVVIVSSFLKKKC